MARGKYCKSLAWRAHDPVFQAARKNARAVYHKIERQKQRMPHLPVTRIIQLLSENPRWKKRMTAQEPQSWKADYYEWDRNRK